jgi:hypothetical protein
VATSAIPYSNDPDPTTDTSGAWRNAAWQSNRSYNQNDVVVGSDGKIYFAISALTPSTDLDPTTDTNHTAWRPQNTSDSMGASAQMPWKANTSYSKGNLVEGSDNNVYQAITDISAGNDLDPTTDTKQTQWQKTASSVSGFADSQVTGGTPTNGYQSMISGTYKDDGSGNPNTSNNRVAANLNQGTSDIQGNAPGDVVGNATSATNVPSGTSAFIDQDAVVKSGGSVSVLAKEKVAFQVTTGAVSGGLVAVGRSVAVATIQSNTDAHIGSRAGVTAGPAVGDTVTVNAALNSNSKGTSFGGSLGAVALGAQVIVITDNSTQDAHIDPGAMIDQSGGPVTVEADADRTVTPLAAGGGVGAIAIGAAVAVGNLGGFTFATANGADIGQAQGMTVGGLNITASATNVDNAQSYAAQGGVGIVAINATAAVASVTPQVPASAGPNSLVNSVGDVTIDASSGGSTNAQAFGISLSTGLALGASVALATLTPSVTASIGSGSTVVSTLGNVTVEALHNQNAGSSPPTPVGSSDQVYAQAISGSGGAVVAFAGAFTVVTDSPMVNAYVGPVANDPTVTSSGPAATTVNAGPGGSVTVLGAADNNAGAESVGSAAAVLGSIAINTPDANVGGSISAQLNGNVRRGQGVVVSAVGTGGPAADIKAGSAGLLTGTINVAGSSLTTALDAHIGNGTAIAVGGDVAVGASSSASSTAQGFAASLGLLAFGIVDTTATLSPSVTAYIGVGSNVSAGGNLGVVAANNYDTTQKAAIAGAQALSVAEAPLTLGIGVAGNGAVPTAYAQASVQGFAAQGAVLSAVNTLTIEADSANVAVARAKALAVALGGAIGTSVSTATAGNATQARLDGSVSGADSLAVTANALDTAQANAAAASGAILAGTGASSTTTVGPALTQASTGPASNISGVAQGTDIQADASNQANSEADGNTGGLVAIGVILTSATDTAQTAAFTLGNVSTTNLTVDAQADDLAIANSGATSGGLIAVNPDNTATSDVEPVVGAAIGADPLDPSVVPPANTVDAAGTINVNAIDRPEGDAVTNNQTYGAVAAGGSVTQVTAKPKATSTIGTGSTVHGDGGNLSVIAKVIPQGSISAPDYTIKSVVPDGAGPPNNDALQVLNNGLSTGDVVYYDNGSNPPIEGLVGRSYITSKDSSGKIVTTLVLRDYGVLNLYDSSGQVDPNYIALGAAFQGSAVNPTNDTISFARPHHLQSGDQVIFEGFTDKNGILQTIGGLTPGQPYYVWVIDPTTIKLTTNEDQATASGHASYLNSFTAADVSSSTINLPTAPTHPLSEGEAVTYHGPQPDTFSSAAVNAIPIQVTDPNTGQTVTTIETDANGNPVDNPGANYIVIPGHGFNTGDDVLYQDQSIWQITIPNHGLRRFDRVVYNNGGGPDIPGLQNGGQYYVIRVDANTRSSWPPPWPRPRPVSASRWPTPAAAPPIRSPRGGPPTSPSRGTRPATRSRATTGATGRPTGSSRAR